MKESIDEKSSVISKHRPFLAFKYLPVSKLWTKLLFSIDDEFCDTACHAAFAVITSIEPFCF